MLWYLIKYNSQGMWGKLRWTLLTTETSYASAEGRLEFLNKEVNVNYMIVSSPRGKQYLPQVVEYKLSQLIEQVKVA